MAGDDEDARTVARPSVPDLFARLIADARSWARAEIAVLRTRGSALAAGVRSGAILIVAAILMATAALVALAVGLVLSLAAVVGPALATLIVVAALLALAGLCGWLGWARIARTFEDTP